MSGEEPRPARGRPRQHGPTERFADSRFVTRTDTPAPRHTAARPPRRHNSGWAAGDEAAASPGARSSPGRPAGAGLLSDGPAPLTMPRPRRRPPPRSPRRRRQHSRAHQRPDPARLRFLFNRGAARRGEVGP